MLFSKMTLKILLNHHWILIWTAKICKVSSKIKLSIILNFHLIIFLQVEDKLAAKLHKIASVPLGATIATFGLIGNIISIIVWNRLIKSKLKDNQSTGLYFIALAFCDGGLLVFFLLSDTLKSNNPSLSHNYIFASFWAWFAFPVFFIFVVASIWMVVGVTLNRYVMIQFPTRVRKIYSKSRTLVSIAIFFSFSVIVNIPHFFTYTVPCRNGTYSIEFTEYGKGKGSTNYEFWVHCIFLVLAPWLTIIVLNTLILRKLSKQMKKVKEMKGNSDKGTHQGLIIFFLGTHYGYFFCGRHFCHSLFDPCNPIVH